MNTKMPFLWKMLMLGMQQSAINGILHVPLMKLDFKSWRIGLVFNTFMWDTGEDLWYMYYFQPSHTSFVSPDLFNKFTSMLPIILILHNKFLFFL
jgi:hypothetical protein